MFCTHCGKTMTKADVFCVACGAPASGRAAAAAALMPTQNRLAGHVRLLGILWIAISAMHVLPGIVLGALFSNPDFPPDAPPVVHSLISAMSSMLVLVGLTGICAGVGLLNRARWARGLAVVVGCLSLIEMPFGTALGIYTLWVLLPAQSEEAYRDLSEPALA